MRTWFTVVFILIAGIMNAQDTEEPKNIIEMNTKFTLKLIKADSGYEYAIINKKPYDQLIDLKNVYSLFPDSRSDEIQGILAYTNYDKEQNAFLILKSGQEVPLRYNLLIKRSISPQFERSSTLNLFFNIPSTEIWPFNIDAIVLSGFEDAVAEP